LLTSFPDHFRHGITDPDIGADHKRAIQASGSGIEPSLSTTARLDELPGENPTQERAEKLDFKT
jgi:hypothetical protein